MKVAEGDRVEVTRSGQTEVYTVIEVADPETYPQNTRVFSSLECDQLAWIGNDHFQFLCFHEEHRGWIDGDYCHVAIKVIEKAKGAS